MLVVLLFVVIGLLTSQVHCHGYITNFWNPTEQSYGECIRPYADLAKVKDPITVKLSNEMTCGHLPEAASFPDKTCSVAKAGDKVALQWTVMYSGHLGPIQVYMASVDSKGDGDAWWKVYNSGYNASTRRWATEDLWDNDGTLWFNIPDYLPAGGYIIRGEVIALHNASYTDGAQFYVNCVHIQIEDAEESDPVDVEEIPKVAFPGYYTDDTPGLHINIWIDSLDNYPEIGPSVYTPSATTSMTASAAASLTSSTSSASSTSASSFSSASSSSSVTPSSGRTLDYDETSELVFVSTSALPSSSEGSVAAPTTSSRTLTAVFPDLDCSSGSATSMTSSGTLTAVFPDLSCTISGMAASATESGKATTVVSTVVQMEDSGVTTITVTPSAVTVIATVTEFVYATESVTNVVTITQLDIAYVRR